MITIFSVVVICSGCFAFALLCMLLFLLNYRIDKIERRIDQFEVRMLENMTITMFNLIDAINEKKEES